MPLFPTVNETRQTVEMTDVFGGYNHNAKINDGEFFDMMNLTSSYYPLLSVRDKRSTVGTLEAPHALLGKTELAWVDGNRLFYGGEYTGLWLNNRLPKRLVSMGAYILVWPDKKYLNTEDFSDAGSMEAHYRSSGEVSVEICRQDGNPYRDITVSDTAPENPQNGALWIDTTALNHTLKQYSSYTSTWNSIATVYTKISAAGIGRSFSKLDGVNIAGLRKGETETEQEKALNGSQIIYELADDYIVIVGLIDEGWTQTTEVTVDRNVPDMDFVTEAQNRIWGCKYGTVDGKSINEIYCCSLGSFKNWEQYLGLASDSYRASVGTDGAWTGAITHNGYPIFFKEGHLHKVYVSATGAHQIMDTACRGVQPGCEKSLVVVNETLFYKSSKEICAYDGSAPQGVSAALGSETYTEAVAGCSGDKYMVSMKDAGGAWHLFVLDTARGLWHREDATHALDFARVGTRTYWVDADTYELICADGSDGQPENGAINWYAETGIMGYATVNRKYISRFNIRMRLPRGSVCHLAMEYDSSGNWEDAGTILGNGLDTFMLPVRPRRCDHFRFRIEGHGPCRIFSISKVSEAGSDVT